MFIIEENPKTGKKVTEACFVLVLRREERKKKKRSKDLNGLLISHAGRWRIELPPRGACSFVTVYVTFRVSFCGACMSTLVNFGG